LFGVSFSKFDFFTSYRKCPHSGSTSEKSTGAYLARFPKDIQNMINWKLKTSFVVHHPVIHVHEVMSELPPRL
jgi:hypothetical protein